MENNIVWAAEIIDKNYCCNGCRGIINFKVFSSERLATDWAIQTHDQASKAYEWGEYDWEVYALTLDQPNA